MCCSRKAVMGIKTRVIILSLKDRGAAPVPSLIQMLSIQYMSIFDSWWWKWHGRCAVRGVLLLTWAVRLNVFLSNDFHSLSPSLCLCLIAMQCVYSILFFEHWTRLRMTWAFLWRKKSRSCITSTLSSTSQIGVSRRAKRRTDKCSKTFLR